MKYIDELPDTIKIVVLDWLAREDTSSIKDVTDWHSDLSACNSLCKPETQELALIDSFCWSTLTSAEFSASFAIAFTMETDVNHAIKRLYKVKLDDLQ